MKTIEITVASNGQAKVETHGFVGSDCQEASRYVEQALGKTDTQHLKPEFHQASMLDQQQVRE